MRGAGGGGGLVMWAHVWHWGGGLVMCDCGPLCGTGGGGLSNVGAYVVLGGLCNVSPCVVP